ncbi:hypothetical protein CEXT_86431 [Caerostris extrusa]|uniref:Uncharacterized protein n=1 Tax=Caerostris extrusa TaxID=172846 RepID=A0AAV4U3H8_CAEEX|nr:hypothetical protein CEXT_86431 [Caerostris extrusa]
MFAVGHSILKPSSLSVSFARVRRVTQGSSWKNGELRFDPRDSDHKIDLDRCKYAQPCKDGEINYHATSRYTFRKRRAAIKRCSLQCAVNQKRSQIYVYSWALDIEAFLFHLLVSEGLRRAPLGKWRTSFQSKRWIRRIISLGIGIPLSYRLKI